MTALAITVRCGDERPPTMNQFLAGSWWDHSPITARWRHAAAIACQRKLARCQDRPAPPLQVTVKPWYRDRRSWPDVAAQLPAVKACIDGCVDAGLLPDDTDDLIARLIFETAGVDPEHGPSLVLLFEEMPK
jgi:hypothetical protein